MTAGSPDGQAHLLGDRLGGRLRRGRRGRLRLGGTRRRAAPVRQRPRAAGRHLPLRAPDVPDDALLGDRRHGARPAAFRPGVRRHLAGSREDRVLHDTPISAGRPDTDRTELRSRQDPATEVGHRARHDSRRGGPGRAGHQGRAGRRAAAVPGSRHRRRWQAGAAPTASARIWNCWTPSGSQAVLSTSGTTPSQRDHFRDAAGRSPRPDQPPARDPPISAQTQLMALCGCPRRSPGSA